MEPVYSIEREKAVPGDIITSLTQTAKENEAIKSGPDNNTFLEINLTKEPEQSEMPANADDAGE